ncbi:MAG TPA: hypothetical protein IAA00_09425 [Candidatus Blautia ornithocaccae]|nr:hypothetical protein [Candidatus Blautia ornithocaccae]
MKNDRIVMGIITVYTGVGPIFRKEYGKDCISEKPALMRSRKQEKKLANKRIHLAGKGKSSFITSVMEVIRR